MTRLSFEENATDHDAEVVFEIKGAAEGLRELKVVAPDGRTVLNFTAPDKSSLGLRQFRLETPEPTDLKRLKAAYPEGVYTFVGSAGGVTLQGKAPLSHKVPAAPVLLSPGADARDVNATNLTVRWTPIKGVTGYALYIEQPDLDVEITARLPGSATSFAVPNGFLAPGTAYQLGLGTVGAGGNSSFIETTFTTATAK